MSKVLNSIIIENSQNENKYFQFGILFVTEGLIQCISLGDHDFTTDTETVSIKRGYLDAS